MAVKRKLEKQARVPADLGAAYVVIQHLSPTHESIPPELLHRNKKEDEAG